MNLSLSPFPFWCLYKPLHVDFTGILTQFILSLWNTIYHSYPDSSLLRMIVQIVIQCNIVGIVILVYIGIYEWWWSPTSPSWSTISYTTRSLKLCNFTPKGIFFGIMKCHVINGQQISRSTYYFGLCRPHAKSHPVPEKLYCKTVDIKPMMTTMGCMLP